MYSNYEQYVRIFKATQAFFKATQIKRDESDFQSLIKVQYDQKSFQTFVILKM